MDYKKIVIAGGGILGSQIAFQSAYCGYDVTILIREEDSKEDAEEKLNKLKDTYKKTIGLMSKEGIKESESWARGIASIDNFDKEECLNKVKIAM